MRALRASLVAAGMLVWASGFEEPASAQARKAKKECAFELVSPMSFGNYDPMSEAPLDLLGQISYRCFISELISRDTLAQGPDFSPINVEITISEGLSNSFHRSMTGSRDSLEYNLYIDALHLEIWGDGTPGTLTYTSRALPNRQVTTVPVFGRIFRGQDVTVGPYLDDVIVTLNF
jgi:spore coat protein U-like protein